MIPIRHLAALAIFIVPVGLVSGGDLSFSDPAKVPAPPAGAVGQANRDPSFDVWPGFVQPPPGFGDVAFFWWLGDRLTKERLQWEIDQLAGKGVSGLQINYAHDDKGGRTYGLTFPSDPPLFSEDWWNLTKWFLQAAKAKGMSVSLSDYTLGTAGQGSYIDEILEKNPGLRGATLTHEAKDITGGAMIELPVPPDAISLVAFRIDQGKVVPGSGVDLTKSITNGRAKWNAPPGLWKVVAVASQVHELSVDPMDPEIGRKVIEVFFQRFEDRNPGEAGKALNFFFSDELQFGVSGNLWNARFAGEFQKRKGYDLRPEMAALFLDIGPRTPKVRLDYRDVMVALQEEGYFKPLFDWHQKHGMIYGCDHGGRGRDVAEFGDYFRTQRWNQGPGTDQPRLAKDLIKAKVAASIAHLYNRPRVWLEGFYGSGWGTTSAEVADATFANFAMGYNLLTLHGLYYSTKGGWWEWAPPCNHFHMPYWAHMGEFLHCVERFSFLASQGHHVCDTAVLYPVAAVEAGMNGPEAVQAAFGAGTALYNHGLDFDFMDFESLARAEVRDGRLHVSEESYRVLVLPAMKAARWSTLTKAAEFRKAGGTVIVLGSPPEASDRVGRDDPELQKLVAEMKTRASSAEEVVKLVEGSGPRDYAGPGLVNHRRVGSRDVYFLYNAPKETRAIFRATGRVELWDPWTGRSRPVSVLSQHDGLTELPLPLGEKEAQIVVFSPGTPEAPPAPSAALRETKIEGDWEFEMKPVLDNRFGDFHWPATPSLIGAEARQFEYSTTGDAQGPWQNVTASYGPMMWKLGPVPDDFDESQLLALLAVDPGKPVVSNGKSFAWQPYEFSWRWGKQGDPGHQGYHGLKGVVTDQFLCLGTPKPGKNETLYGPEEGGGRYYLWTSVPADAETEAHARWGGLKPAAIWVGGMKTTANVRLKRGSNPLLWRYDSPGRGFLVMERGAAKPELAGDEPFSAAARWIWYPQERANGDRWFRKTFELAKVDPQARLRITCDNGYAVRVNGKEAGRGQEWTAIQEYALGSMLLPGRNEIVVRASNTGDSAGLIAELTCGTTHIATDTTWQAARNESGAWVGAEVIAPFVGSLWHQHPQGPPQLEAAPRAAKPVFVDHPLAMTFWKNPSVLPFDAFPRVEKPVGFYRFTSPPGLRALDLTALGKATIKVGNEVAETKDGRHFTVAKPSPDPVPVIIRIEQTRGAFGGAAIPEYVKLDCGAGKIAAGDWGRLDGLRTYSGGAWYRKTLDLPAAQQIILDLGEVVSTAEVRVNDQPAGLRVAPPWTFDISSLARPGSNRIEILVYNTASNHYLTVPTHYNKPTPSGLLGPVKIWTASP